jgi:photosystem II stability/assembly factor-like uncharacterized protein
MRKFLFLFILVSLFCNNIYSQKYPQVFESRGMGGGGALYVPSINPYNNDEFYISCDMSETFHTTNYGKSYEILPFTAIQTSHQSKVRFTSNPQVMYNVNFANDLTVPVKSIDGGKTFQALKGTPADDQFQNLFVNSDGTKVVISFYGTIYLSLNSGDSFKKIHTCLNNGTGNLLGGVFFNGNSIYLGTNDGLLYSEDNGNTFQTMSGFSIPSDEAIYSFSGAYDSGTLKLYCLTAKLKDIYVFMFDNDPEAYRAWDNAKNDFTGFCKSLHTYNKKDGSNGSWLKASTFDSNTDFMMWVSNAENDVDTVYMAGGSKSSSPSVLRSIDGGANFAQVFLSNNNQNVNTGWSGDGGDRAWSYGEVALGFTVCPNNSQRLIITDFGFPHISSDGGANWFESYVNPSDANAPGKSTPKGKSYNGIGIENTTCWQVSWLDKDNIFACFSDIKGIRSTDAGKSWNQNYTGHNANSMYRLVQHQNGTLFAGTSNIHDIYQSTRLADNILDANDAYGKVIYSTDKGSSWKDIKAFNHPVFWVALDPNNQNTMYASVIHYANKAGQGGIWVTKDLNKLNAATWTKLPNPPRSEGHPASIVVLNDGNVVCTYSGRRAPSFTASSGCFIYNPNTNSWTDVSDNGMKYWTKDIIIDPNDATQNTWYVAVFSGWGGAPNGLGGLYKTTNRGTNWTKINTFDRVTSITFDPNNTKQAYLTTEQLGLWFSSNMDAVKPSFELVSAYKFRQPERVYFNPFNKDEVWVSSFGNGISVGTVGSVAPAEFTITGNIKDVENNVFLSNVSIELSGKSSSTYTTNNTGNYTIKVPIGKYTITPNLKGFTFFPNSATFEILEGSKIQDFVGMSDTPSFLITVSSNAGGLVEPNGIIKIKQGSDTTFNFIPSKGYIVSKVMIDGVVEPGTPIKYTLKNVTKNHTVEVTFENSNNVQDIEEIGYSIYPNPAKDVIYNDNNILSKFNSYSIINVNGEIVRDFGILKAELSLRNLSNGTYYLIFKSNSNLRKAKIIVNN